MDIEILKEIGLSESEIKVYLATLKTGAGTTSDVAENCGLPRTTTYSILKSLMIKGFVAYAIKSGVKYFSAVSPRNILEKVREKEKRLKNLIPELEELQKLSVKRAKIEFYEGKEGFKTVANNLIITPNSEILCYLPEAPLQFLPIFHLQFRRRRKEKRIRVKMISEKSKMIQQIRKNDKQELRKIRYLAEVMKDSKVATFIYGNKVAMITVSPEQQIGIIIEDKQISDNQRLIFENLWKIAKN